MKNGRKTGCFHAVGGLEAVEAAPAVVIAEGYATAASLAEALSCGTVAAFDAGNLVAVATALPERFPDKTVIVAGGRRKPAASIPSGTRPKRRRKPSAASPCSQRSRPATRRIPKRTLTDFNDLANAQGLGEVKRQIAAGLAQSRDQNRDMSYGLSM